MTEQSTLRRRVIPLTLFPLFGLCAVLLFAALLISLRLEKTVADLIEQRTKLITSQVVEVAEGGLRFGISVVDQAPLKRKLESLISSDDQLLKIRVIGDQGNPVFTAAQGRTTSDLAWPTLRRALSQEPSSQSERYVRSWKEKSERHVLMQVRDAIGQTAAIVWVVYSNDSARATFMQTIDRLLLACMWMILVGALIFSLFVATIWYPWEEHINAHYSASGTDSSALVESPIPGVSVDTVMKEISTAERALDAIEHKMRGAQP
jgi:hypothetical protein